MRARRPARSQVSPLVPVLALASIVSFGCLGAGPEADPEGHAVRDEDEGPLLLPPEERDQRVPGADDETPAPPPVEEAVDDDAFEDLGLPAGGYVKAHSYRKADERRTGALAELYSGAIGPAETPATFYETFPADACFQVPVEATEPTFYDFVDVGEVIALDGPARVELARELLFSNIFYRAAGASAQLLDDGAVYDVRLGSDGPRYEGALLLPPLPSVSSPAGFAGGEVVHSRDEPLEVVFEPFGAGAAVFLLLQSGDAGRVCRLEDDGHFVVPPSALAGAPSSGTLVLLALGRNLVEHEGRQVELLGESGLVADYFLE